MFCTCVPLSFCDLLFLGRYKLTWQCRNRQMVLTCTKSKQLNLAKANCSEKWWFCHPLWTFRPFFGRSWSEAIWRKTETDSFTVLLSSGWKQFDCSNIEIRHHLDRIKSCELNLGTLLLWNGRKEFSRQPAFKWWGLKRSLWRTQNRVNYVGCFVSSNVEKKMNEISKGRRQAKLLGTPNFKSNWSKWNLCQCNSDVCAKHLLRRRKKFGLFVRAIMNGSKLRWYFCHQIYAVLLLLETSQKAANDDKESKGKTTKWKKIKWEKGKTSLKTRGNKDAPRPWGQALNIYSRKTAQNTALTVVKVQRIWYHWDELQCGQKNRTP